MPQPMKKQIPETMTLDQAKQLLEQQGIKVVSEEIPIPDKTDIMEEILPEIDIHNRDLPNGRFYMLDHQMDLPEEWIPSVTTQLSSIHKGHGFNTWNRNLSHLAPRDRDGKAIKGIHIHYPCLEQMARGMEVTDDMIHEMVASDENKDWKFHYKNVHLYVNAILRNMWSFQQFWEDHKPTPIAIEYPLFNEEIRIAGRFDMLVRMKKTKAAKKESLILIDLKTGGKYWTHAIQNSAYKVAWEQEHPAFPIDYIACLYVRDTFRDKPTYDLHFQKFDYETFKAASKIWHKEHQNVKGVVVPTIRPRAPRRFKLY